jgi:hypothetical protein
VKGEGAPLPAQICYVMLSVSHPMLNLSRDEKGKRLPMWPSSRTAKSGLLASILTPVSQGLGLHRDRPTSGRAMGPHPRQLTYAVPGSVAECGATCESCFSQDFCIRCKRRFHLYKGKCLPSCPPGTLTHQSTRECQGE